MKPIITFNENINYLYLCENPNLMDLFYLDDDLLNKIYEYADNDKKYVWEILSGNPYVFPLLEKNIKHINLFTFCENENPKVIEILNKLPIQSLPFYYISKNPNAIKLLEENINEIVWEQLSFNKNAIHILENNQNKICWNNLCYNENAVHLLVNNLDKVYHGMGGFCSNPNAIHYLEQNINKINWIGLSINPNAIHILEKNLDKVDWSLLSKNPNAIYILEKNLDKVNWDLLCMNPNAVHIIEKNLNKINWRYLSKNPNAIHLLFNYNYEKMLSNNKEFTEELVAYVFNPKRLLKLCNTYNIDFLDYIDLY